jgi:hypothetical protein
LPLSIRDYIRFLQFMVAHGLSPATVSAIVRQIAKERRNPKVRWRRATILDKLQWDLFKHRYRRDRPALSTFFLNSTAHYQHMYWRNMDPTGFTVQAREADHEEYGDAILYGYREMDRIVGEAIALADDGRTVLILASALSQQPCLLYEDIGGKTFYRPRVFDRVLDFAGVNGPCRVEPVMSEQFHIRFERKEAAAAASLALSGLSISGRRAMSVECKDGDVFAGCCIYEQLPPDVILNAANGRAMEFFRLFYQVEGVKSGMHHPDGILWIREPGIPPQNDEQRVSLRDVAPTVLSFFGVDPPPEMTGRSVRSAPVPVNS